MRKECRKRGIRRLRVLFSTEEARAATTPEGQERGQRGGLGTMPYFPPIMGQMIAGEVIRTIGFWRSKEDLENSWQLDTRFEPSMELDDAAKLYKGWQKAVRHAMHWMADED